MNKLKNRLLKLEEKSINIKKELDVIIWYKDMIKFNNIEYSQKDFNEMYPYLKDDKPIKYGMTRIKIID